MAGQANLSAHALGGLDHAGFLDGSLTLKAQFLVVEKSTNSCSRSCPGTPAIAFSIVSCVPSAARTAFLRHRFLHWPAESHLIRIAVLNVLELAGQRARKCMHWRNAALSSQDPLDRHVSLSRTRVQLRGNNVMSSFMCRNSMIGMLVLKYL